MMDNTLVAVTGEFGRTPNVLIQQPRTPALVQVFLLHHGRRGHRRWTGVWQVLQPRWIGHQHPTRPEELAVTIYHALDIPLNEPLNNSGISRPITTGKPVMELLE